jgi:hypothetical protein
MPTTTSGLGKQFEIAVARAFEVGKQFPAAIHMNVII